MRLKSLSILFLVALFSVLQSTLLNNIQIFNNKPDILLILVIFFGLNFGPVYGLSLGALCGIFAEVTSGIPTPLAILTYSLGGLALGYIGKLIDKQTLISKAWISFIFTFAVYLALFLLFQALNIKLGLLHSLISVIIPASFYTTCLALPLFRFLSIFEV